MAYETASEGGREAPGAGLAGRGSERAVSHSCGGGWNFSITAAPGSAFLQPHVSLWFDFIPLFRF